MSRLLTWSSKYKISTTELTKTIENSPGCGHVSKVIISQQEGVIITLAMVKLCKEINIRDIFRGSKYFRADFVLVLFVRQTL